MKVYVYKYGRTIEMFTEKLTGVEAERYEYVGEYFLAVTTLPTKEEQARYV